MCAAEHAGTLRDIRRLPPDHPQEGPTHTCVTGHKASGLGGPHGSSHELQSWQIHKERGGEQVREVLSAQVCGTSATSLPISQGKLCGEAASEAAQEVQLGKLRLVGPATSRAPHSLDGNNCIEGFSSTYRLSGIKLGLFKLICSNALDTAGCALSPLFHR